MTAETDAGKKDGQAGEAKKDDASDKDKAELRSMVAEMVESALKPFMDRLGESKQADPPANNPAAGGDLAKMVDDAITKVLGDRDKQSADDEHRKQHEAIAAAAEKKPVNRPKRSGWLGNIWDKDA